MSRKFHFSSDNIATDVCPVVEMGRENITLRIWGKSADSLPSHVFRYDVATFIQTWNKALELCELRGTSEIAVYDIHGALSGNFLAEFHRVKVEAVRQGLTVNVTNRITEVPTQTRGKLYTHANIEKFLLRSMLLVVSAMGATDYVKTEAARLWGHHEAVIAAPTHSLTEESKATLRKNVTEVIERILQNDHSLSEEDRAALKTRLAEVTAEVLGLDED